MELLKEDGSKVNSSDINANKKKEKGATLKDIDEKAKNPGVLKMEESRTCCCIIW